ncbi:hypothetical protein LJK88_02270 [Paenibacillus sp. P26]|nr:hypothetical protein LJK88_02270 [Paenibacillus sp. P26]
MLSERLHGLTAEDNAAGLIFIYLLSQKGKPGIEAILKRLNEASLERSKTWIEVGQKHRVIPEHVDAEKMAKPLNVFKNGPQVQSILSSDADDLSMSDIFMLLVGALGAKNLSD